MKNLIAYRVLVVGLLISTLSLLAFCWPKLVDSSTRTISLYTQRKLALSEHSGVELADLKKKNNVVEEVKSADLDVLTRVKATIFDGSARHTLHLRKFENESTSGNRKFHNLNQLHSTVRKSKTATLNSSVLYASKFENKNKSTDGEISKRLHPGPKVFMASNSKGARSAIKPSVSTLHKLLKTEKKNPEIKKNRSQKMRKAEVPQNLSPWVLSGVKKFVFFIGYARSGHSIIGTLMDAHPHVVIANEFNLFTQFEELDKVSDLTWRDNLYNMLYRRSRRDSRGSRADSKKGYQLGVNGLWQGKFDRYIEVIGDKSGSMTTKTYSKNGEELVRNFMKLKSRVSIPLHIIHAVRNPFDIIATSVVIMNENRTTLRELKMGSLKEGDERDRFENKKIVDGGIQGLFHRFNDTMKLIELFGKANILEVHNCDLVDDPRGTISKIFKFLDVHTTEHYLDVCAEKVFKSVSRSRNMVSWTPEQIEEVEEGMKKYAMLDRYSFTSD